MTQYYETTHGWPCTVETRTDGWLDVHEYVIMLGEERVSRLPTAPNNVFFVDQSVPVSPENYPDIRSFMADFHNKWAGKYIYVKANSEYFKFQVSPYVSLNPTTLRCSAVWGYFDLFLGREAIYSRHSEVVIPYTDIPTCDTLIGVGDFTHGDLVHLWEVPMVDFVQANVSSKYHWKIQLFQPKVSHKFQGKVSLYMSKKDKERDRLTALRPGRAFKIMFPELNDKDIAQLVDKFNLSFPLMSLKLHTGSEEADFIKAYSYEQSVMQNVYTTSSRKSLANSCMRLRPEHVNLPKHPAAAYASGDFLSIWTEDEGGRIASRCVLYLNPEGRPQAGPVYGTTEGSIDEIEDHLKSLGADLYQNASWMGARLLYIECNGGALAPYLDHEKCLEIAGEYLLITGGDEDEGDFHADTYGGVLHPQGGTHCECCSDRIDHDDLVTTEDGLYYCSSCYSDNYSTCYEDGQEYRTEDMTVTRVRKYRWGWQEEYVYDPDLHGYMVYDGWYYHPDLLVETEQGDYHLEGEDTYFTCEKTGEYHNIQEQVEALIGGVLLIVSKTWVEDNDYVIGSDFVYTPKEEEQEEAA